MPVRLKRCSGPCDQFYPITHFWSDAGSPDGRMSRCPTCEKNARRYNAKARAAGELDGAVETVNGRVVHFSEAERQRRSDLAKRLHAEGRFGGSVIGARGGRAVTRHRLSDAVLEYFRQPDEQRLVVNAYRSALKGKNKPLRVRAADSLMRLDKDTAERERADRGGAVDPASMPEDELLELVQQGIEAMIERGEIPVDVVLGDEDVKDVE